MPKKTSSSRLNKELEQQVAALSKASEALKAGRQRLNDVLETLPAYLILLTPDHRVAFANRFFRERFGECCGQRCFEYLFHRTEPCEVCETYKVLQTTKPLEWEWTGPDGRNYYIYDFPFTDTDGSTLIMEVGLDITERKRAEAALKEANETLEQRVAERTADLQRANEQLHVQAEELQAQGDELQAQTEELTAANEELREQEQALRESEERFKLAAQSVSDIIWQWDIGAGEVSWHGRIDELLGYGSGQFPRTVKAWEGAIHPEDRGRVLTALDGHLKRDLPYREEYRVLRKDGTVSYWRDCGIAQRDDAGRPCRMIGSISDITGRKQAEEALRESEERLKRAQAIGHLGSWELDLSKDKLTWSDEVYRIFGLEPQEFGASYKAFLERVHPEDRAAVDAAYSDSLRQNRDAYEIEHRVIRHRTGEIRHVHEKCQHVRDKDGKIVLSLGMVLDITERKRAEESLRELNATLESKVAQRTAELEHRARQLQKLTLEVSETEDRERKRMADILHDDLQQQLVAAKFHLSILNNRLRRDTQQRAITAQLDQMLMEAVETSRSLSHDLSPAVLHQGDLGQTFEWLARQMQTRHGLTVRVESHGEVNLQSDAMKMFLYKAGQELLFNVVKHARVKEATIRLRRWGRYAGLSVMDRGRGFDPQRLNETAGFGLFGIHERVELLGGHMKIRSEEGKGSTFLIVVPDDVSSGAAVRPKYRELRASASSSPPDESMPVAGDRRLRVLLADDHEVVRQGLKVILSEEPDVEVVGEAANGREAVDLAGQLKPDVVIMDVSMPLISGDQATRQIKKQWPQTRVIALSMYNEPETVKRMRRAGAESYVLKTAPSQELLAAIRGKEPCS